MIEFITVKLKDISNIYNGKTPSTSDENNFGGDIPWITPKDLSILQTQYISKGERNISKQGFKAIGGIYLPKGTILLSSRAPIGLLSIASNPLTTNQGFKNIVCDSKKVDYLYLYYLLKTKISDIENLGTGTTFKEVSKSVLEEFSIKIHSNIKNQQSIANVLSTLDQKIAINNQINAQLEQMAKTLYDYWFVQFDFPDENGKPYKSSGGEMVYNETLKREIPKGWEDQKISHWLQSDKSGDWGKEMQEGNYTLRVNCIRGADINVVNFQGNIEAPIRFILPKNKHKLLSPFDLVVEISGGSPTQSTGRLAPISDYVLNRFDFPVICSNFCKAISLKNTFYFYQFVFMWNAIYKNDVLFGWEGKTSGIKNLLFENFTEGYFECYPPLNLVKNFFEIADVFHKQQQSLLKQNQQLAQLRDFLLPMLMNGQVGVDDE